ncbi:putative inactive cadmium/zinc-transporting ATPase HMA3 [Wolffia australiana]
MAVDDGNRRGMIAAKPQKSYLDVLGLCCSSEVPLVEKILQPLPGVISVSVIITSRTVIVLHDPALISPAELAKALNEARLEASVRGYGEKKRVRQWPSPYTIACGVLLAISFLKPVYRPLQWLAVAAAACGLPPIILRAITAMRRLTLDINILMLIAVGGSIALRDFWEAATIVFLFTIAEWLESRATFKATSMMSALASMGPQTAVLAATGHLVDVNDVEIDTVLAVKAGEVIPVDGVVVEGRSEVDESSLTGESFPVPKHPLSLVWAGTINLNGYLAVRTTALAENSAVAKMTKLVEDAQNARSKTQRMIDSCAKYYTPAVLLATVLVAVVPVAAKVNNVKYWLRMSLVLLVSACPCALVLSTPVATFCALGAAAKLGVLIKGGDILEALARTKVVAFDKTGTITRGEFTVADFSALGNSHSLQELLYWVSSLECKSSHPMATALVDHARSCSVVPRPEAVKDFFIFPGEGIYGEIDGKKIFVGNSRIAVRAGCNSVPKLAKETRGTTAGYVFADGSPVGVFSLTDTCRTGAGDAVATLKRMGIKAAMLTGDSGAAAISAQNQLGNAMDMVHAELRPEDKVNIVMELKAKLGSTVMVGDGINDAPALAAADVGISMGISGSAIAMETSHIALMSNDIRKIPIAILLGKRTQNKIIQNIIMSVTTKAAIIALAFAGHPLLWAAILSDVGTCLLVIFNSMLLLTSTKRSRTKCCGSAYKLHAHEDGVHRHEGSCQVRASPCTTHCHAAHDHDKHEPPVRNTHSHKHHHHHDTHRHHIRQCNGHDHGHGAAHIHGQNTDKNSAEDGGGQSVAISVVECGVTLASEDHHHHHDCLHEHGLAARGQISEVGRGGHAACGEAIVCKSTCHKQHHCGDFRKRPAGSCCQSSCGGDYAGAFDTERCCASSGDGLAELKEILTDKA